MRKTFIVCGLILGAGSLALPFSVIGMFMFLAGFTLVAVAVVVPFVTFVINPFVNLVLDSVIGEKMGVIGRGIFKFLFYVPAPKRGKRRARA